MPVSVFGTNILLRLTTMGTFTLPTDILPLPSVNAAHFREDSIFKPKSVFSMGSRALEIWLLMFFYFFSSLYSSSFFVAVTIAVLQLKDIYQTRNRLHILCQACFIGYVNEHIFQLCRIYIIFRVDGNRFVLFVHFSFDHKKTKFIHMYYYVFL